MPTLDPATLFKSTSFKSTPFPEWLLVIFLVCASSSAAANGLDRFSPYGDFRLRLEQDWDSTNGDGTQRDDRLRLRVRIRAGIRATINEKWSANIAVRSGPHKSQQSPHITVYDFDGGDTGPYQFNLDHWYLKFSQQGFSAWAGRNELSYWHQDDLFVFDNVTYPGIGASYQHGFAGGQLSWNLNYVALPVGMRDTSGTGLVGQLVFDKNFLEQGFTLAAGFFHTRADKDDPDGDLLLTENGQRDYQAVNFVAQYRAQIKSIPYYLGFDYKRNFKSYADAAPGSFSAFHKNHRDGFVLEAALGSKGRRGDWLLGYFYSYLEALAVHSSYVADDWVRWGNANQVRATNLKGSEFRVSYNFRDNISMIARVFFVDAIDLLEPGDTTKEDGKRFRLDLDWSF